MKKPLKFKCACGLCKEFLEVSDFKDGNYLFDTLVAKKRVGVVLNKKDIEKLIKYLNL